MKTILRWELMRRKMFTLWWTIGVSGLIGLTVLSYIAVKEDAQEFNQAFEGLTDSAGAFFGGTDFFSPVGYLSSQIYYIMLPLLLIIMVMTLVSSLMAKDENDTTVELTLARPVSRRKLLLAKGLAGLIIVAIVGVLSYLVTYISAQIADIDINQTDLLITHALAFAFSVSFGMIAFTLTAASKVTRKVAGVVAILLSFGGYILSSLAGFVDPLKDLVKAMPYYYYDTAEILSGTVDKGLLIYLAGVLVVTVVVSAIGYSRRDIG
jgi:ABC-2 type transport system permease protein